MRRHIWRIDDTTPPEERPWIVTEIDDQGHAVFDPFDFPTWEQAVNYAISLRGAKV